MRRTSPWKMHTTPTSRGNAGKVGRRPPSTMDQLRDAWSTICRRNGRRCESSIDPPTPPSIVPRRLLRNRSHTRFTRTKRKIITTYSLNDIRDVFLSDESRVNLGRERFPNICRFVNRFIRDYLSKIHETREALSASVLTSV